MLGAIQGTEVLCTLTSSTKNLTRARLHTATKRIKADPASSQLRGSRLLVFALDPNSIHCHLLPTVHLQSTINQILYFLQASSCEEII